MNTKILNPKSDFPFTDDDFVQEFNIYQYQFEVFWFEEVEKLKCHRFFKIDSFLDDIDVLGFNVIDNEFFIGTYEYTWCIFSCKQNLFYSFQSLKTKSIKELYHFLRGDLGIPIEIIYSILRISSKYL
jgi:hypothetical protein